MIVCIPHYSNQIGLSALLVNLQPQLSSEDIIYVVDTSPEKSGLKIAKMFSSSRCITLVDWQPRTIYQAWNAGIRSAYENNQEGVLFLNDDVLLSMTFIKNLKNALKTKADAYVPNTPEDYYKSDRLNPNFKWFSPMNTEVKMCNWLVGFVFYLPMITIETKGSFDENFLIWYGDTDYQMRLNKIARFSEYVMHYGGTSYEYSSEENKKKIKRDELYFRTKHPNTSIEQIHRARTEDC